MIHGLGICSGIGAMELALRLALGSGYRGVGHVERDAYAAAVLVARMAEQALDEAPIWDDIATFDGGPWRGVVDLVTAGFPCQPFSASGKRKGLEDERWIWPSIFEVLGEVQPSIVFIENVPGLVRRGLPVILEDLRQLGFDAEWDCFSAEDVEAPHRRERFWLLAAHPGCRATRRVQQILFGGSDGPTNAPHRGIGAGAEVPNAAGKRLLHRAGISGDPEAPESDLRERPAAHRCADGDSNATGARREREGVPGPEPRQPGWWTPPPGVPLLANGASTNVDRLRCSGNALVPAVAALAFVQLFQRLVASSTPTG